MELLILLMLCRVSIKAVGMFICQSLINCVIVSGTGQAAVTMPLMVPVSDLVGISRQTAVLAFQLEMVSLTLCFQCHHHLWVSLSIKEFHTANGSNL